MEYTIDRFEGKFAVVELENKKFANIPREAIPEKAKEGDVKLTHRKQIAGSMILIK